MYGSKCIILECGFRREPGSHDSDPVAAHPRTGTRMMAGSAYVRAGLKQQAGEDIKDSCN